MITEDLELKRRREMPESQLEIMVHRLLGTESLYATIGKGVFFNYLTMTDLNETAVVIMCKTVLMPMYSFYIGA